MPTPAKILRDIQKEQQATRKQEETKRASVQNEGHQKKLQGCRDDFNAFMEYCFRDARTGQPYIQAQIHREWHAFIDTHHRALILAPREHGKSDQIAIGRTLWELGRNPQLRVKIVSEDDPTAKKRLKAVKGHIERNKRLHEVFPGLKRHPELDDWTQHTITVNREGEDKEPSVEAAGILSSAVGGRADLLIFDDVVDFQNAIAKPTMRELVKESFREVWINLLADEGRAIYIATPWHQGDLTHELGDNPEWAILRQPIREDFTPLWPEMWPTERLQQRAREIGGRAYARGFRLIALSDEDALFRAITRCLRPDLDRTHIQAHWRTYTGVDLGHSRRKASSGRARKEKPYTVIFTLALDEQKRRWPVEIRRGHWTGPETAKQIIEVHQRHLPEAIVVENNAYQDTLLDWIRLVTPDATIPLEPFTTGANKADEQTGLPGLAAEFESGAWIIPTSGGHGEDCRCELCVWVDEMKNYPAAPLSDTIMACWFAREAARTMAAYVSLASFLGQPVATTMPYRSASRPIFAGIRSRSF